MTQEVDAFIEEEIIAPIERQESLKNRVEGKTFEEYEKAQKEAEDLADVGKEIEAALNELESSQTALDSVRQANLVSKNSQSRVQNPWSGGAGFERSGADRSNSAPLHRSAPLHLNFWKHSGCCILYFSKRCLNTVLERQE